MTDRTRNERQARIRKFRAEEGGRLVQVWLSPVATRKLDRLTTAGETIAAAINRLLMASKPKGKA